MRRVVLSLLLTLGLVATAHAQSGGYTVNASPPVNVLPQGGAHFFVRIFNVSPSGGAVAWCTRQSNRPGVNLPGSYPIQPGQMDQIGPISSQQGPLPFASIPVWCIASGGTASMTVDAY